MITIIMIVLVMIIVNPLLRTRPRLGQLEEKQSSAVRLLLAVLIP